MAYAFDVPPHSDYGPDIFDLDRCEACGCSCAESLCPSCMAEVEAEIARIDGAAFADADWLFSDAPILGDLDDQLPY